MIVHRNAEHMHHAGRTIVGYYSVDHDHRMITVETLAEAQLGGLSPLPLARILLRELTMEGLEGLTAL
jgi:hypothetical protein